MATTIRRAEPSDAAGLTELRAIMFEAMGHSVAAGGVWRMNARAWFERNLATADAAAFVAESVNGELVAAALGTIGHNVPSPSNPAGVRGHVSNVVTCPEWRRNGLARLCVDHLLRWFDNHGSVGSVDLFATGEGAELYRGFGFEQRPHPAMRLELPLPDSPSV